MVPAVCEFQARRLDAEAAIGRAGSRSEFADHLHDWATRLRAGAVRSVVVDALTVLPNGRGSRSIRAARDLMVRCLDLSLVGTEVTAALLAQDAGLADLMTQLVAGGEVSPRGAGEMAQALGEVPDPFHWEDGPAVLYFELFPPPLDVDATGVEPVTPVVRRADDNLADH